MSKLTIEAQQGQVREITTKSGDKFTFVVTSATRAIIEIDPGDDMQVSLNETASAARIATIQKAEAEAKAEAKAKKDAAAAAAPTAAPVPTDNGNTTKKKGAANESR